MHDGACAGDQHCATAQQGCANLGIYGTARALEYSADTGSTYMQKGPLFSNALK